MTTGRGNLPRPQHQKEEHVSKTSKPAKVDARYTISPARQRAMDKLEAEKQDAMARFNLAIGRQVTISAEHFIEHGLGPFEPELWTLVNGVFAKSKGEDGEKPSNVVPINRAARRRAKKK